LITGEQVGAVFAAFGFEQKPRQLYRVRVQQLVSFFAS